MAPSIKEKDVHTSCDVEHLQQFLVDEAHNLLVFGSTESKRHVFKVANLLGADFE
jgi:hypothetical protein